MSTAKNIPPLNSSFEAYAALPVPLAILDASGTIIFANDGFSELLLLAFTGGVLGANLQKIVGMKSDFGKFIGQILIKPADTAKPFECEFLAGKAPKIVRVTSFTPPESTQFGTTIGLQILDVTNESDLHRKYLDQIKELKSKTVGLLSIAQLAGMGEISAMLTHDLRNILTTVLGYIELLKINVEENDTTEKYLGKAMFALSRMSRLLDNVYDFSRKTSRYEYHDLGKIVENALLLINSKIARASIKVQIDLKHGNTEIRINGPQFEFLLMNMVSNAVDAFENCKLESRKIYIKSRMVGEIIELEVEDNACGITPENLLRIFENNFSTKERGKGLGLGLAICKDVVNAHQGRIEVESEVDKGTKFTIIFPHSNTIASE